MQQGHQPQVDFHGGPAPDWPELRALAAGQVGYFTTAQANARGFSEQLLSKHAARGTLERAMRGIYRLAHSPPGEHEDLVVAWLWSGEEAVVSHESALQLHGLSDAMPARIHLTLPAARRGRRRVVPPLYILHFSDLPGGDRSWVGAVPVTTPPRTILDVAEANGDAAIVEQAINQGIHRRLFDASRVAQASAYAAGFQVGGWRVFPEAVADLGDQWAMRSFAGTCRTLPPSDWPTLARAVAERHGARLYYQRQHPPSGAVAVHLAWPMPGPEPAVVEALRRDLAEVLRWR